MNKELETLAAVERPTRVRFGVLGFVCSLSMITYLDRVCFGTVAPTIQREFGLSDAQKGMLFSAFALAYAVFEVPTGWLGDMFGPRKTLIRIVLWWSVFTALTGMIYPMAALPSYAFLAMLTVRFFFGIGEAGAYPNIAKALHHWLPFGERGFGQGMVWMSGRLAGGLTPLAVLALFQVLEWRHTFWVFGVLGLAWCALFYLWFRDRPEQKASVNAAELSLIRSGEEMGDPSHANVPWAAILRNRNLWVLCAMYFCASYGWYFNITWLPGYLTNRYGIDQHSTGFWTFSLMAGAPLLFGSLACIVGGLLTDAFIRRTGNRKWGRRLFGVVGHGTCALCYFLSLGANNPWMFVLAVAMASFCNDLTMGSAWASCLDIGKRYSGIVAGCMNTIGNLGGAAAGYFTGLILSHYTAPVQSPAVLLSAMSSLGGAAAAGGGGSALGALDYGAAAKLHTLQAMQPGWAVNFLMYGGVYVIATFLWLMFDSTKPIVTDHE
jgi:nitrate/nitrite transporter NarK